MNEICFSAEVIEQDLKRLIGQLWKLIPMRENGEDWQSHLKVVIEEISGLVEIFKSKPEGLILLSKLIGLTCSVSLEDFMIYRKAVFECIELLPQVMRNG